MSGLVGIVTSRGTSPDATLSARLTRTLTARGPDDAAVFSGDGVALGHTLLRTGEAGTDQRQPASLDGRLWITADARVDARADLLARLGGRDRSALHTASAAHLILRAYDAWGPDCVEHLLGDFAFAIWDAATRRLFCARDRFGIKPFYYAVAGDELIFSNTLDCIRQHPRVGSTLNDDAIGDFLLFGANDDWATTTFADIQRLPPAHTLAWEAGTLRIRRYWSVPAGGHIRYRRPDEYVDHFSTLFASAIHDRLPSGDVGVWLSGGIDSSAIAAVARQLTASREDASTLRALTVVYDTLFDDGTRNAAGAAAEALGLAPTFLAADDHVPFAGWERPELRTPEPTDDPFLGMRLQQLRAAAAETRVWLYGEGGDEILWPSTVADLLGHMPWLELARDVGRCLLWLRQRPAMGLRRTLGAWRGVSNTAPPLPAWLNPSFSERCGLRHRWLEAHRGARPRYHPTHPEAAHRLSTAAWPRYFETFDPGATGVPVEGRYPMLDTRLVDYLLAIPPLPWCVNKELLRRSMRGLLPDGVRNQPKRPLGGDPLAARLRRGDGAALDSVETVAQLGEYVNVQALPSLAQSHGSDAPWLNVRPLCLNYWLKYYTDQPQVGSADPDARADMAPLPSITL